MIPRPKAAHTANHDEAPDSPALFNFKRPEWHALAACRGRMEGGRSWWFPEPGNNLDAEQALDICRTCPVRRQCTTAGRNEFGIWGSATRKQRARDRKAERQRLARRLAVLNADAVVYAATHDRGLPC